MSKSYLLWIMKDGSVTPFTEPFIHSILLNRLEIDACGYYLYASEYQLLTVLFLLEDWHPAMLASIQSQLQANFKDTNSAYPCTLEIFLNFDRFKRDPATGQMTSLNFDSPQLMLDWLTKLTKNLI